MYEQFINCKLLLLFQQDDKEKKDEKKSVENGVVQNGIGDEINAVQHQHQHPMQPQLQLQHPQLSHHPQLHQQPHQMQPGHHPQDDKSQPVQVGPEDLQAQMMAAAAVHQNLNGHSGLQQQQQQHHSMGGSIPLDGFDMSLDPSSQAAAGGHPVGFDGGPYGGVNPHLVHPQPPPNVMPPYDQQQVSIKLYVLSSYFTLGASKWGTIEILTFIAIQNISIFFKF